MSVRSMQKVYYICKNPKKLNYYAMKITVFGAGNMGGAIVRGLLNSDIVKKEELIIIDPYVAEFEGIATRSIVSSEIEGSDVVLLAVKPWLAADVVTNFRAFLSPSTMLGSVVAGLTLEQMSEMTSHTQPLVRIMPNTAVSTGEGMTFFATKSCSEVQVELVNRLLSSTGEVMQVEERLINPCMSLASCGIAFALRYIRASVEGGVELGVPASLATKIVAQTLRGAASLLEGGSHPEVEIDKVTTPGGITIKGLNAMEANGFTNSVIEGLKATKI